MPLRLVNSEPGFQPLVDAAEDDGQEVELRRVRYVWRIGENELRRGATFVRTYCKEIFAGGVLIGAVCAVVFIVSLVRTSPTAERLICEAENNKDVKHYSGKSGNMVGVNLGGWLCLEDWFFSGSVGRYVSTPEQIPGQGACLPPLVPGPLEKPWGSEGELVQRLNASNGPKFAAEALRKHREEYITDQDFAQIRSLGLKSVRIPVTWTLFADALKEVDPRVYGAHDPETDTVIVPDPYYVDEIMFATIPRKWLQDKIEAAFSHGLRVILDVHNMPGGSSVGTYSGIWPRLPRFWRDTVQLGPHKGKLQLVKVGMWLVKALIAFVERLTTILEPSAIRGVCFLNEPGHMSAGKNWTSEDQIISYLEDYAHLFRKSALPSRGVRLYIQVIETAFQNFAITVPAWYNSFFTAAERQNWAVIARHFYLAWGNGHCDGKIIQGGAFQCDGSIDVIRGILADCCYSFAGEFAALFDGMRTVTEWSLGTFWDADLQCNNGNVLRSVFEESVKAFTILNASVILEPIFWTWRIPYGPKFQPAWSLKYFSGLADDEFYTTNGRCVVGPWGKLDPLAPGCQ